MTGTEAEIRTVIVERDLPHPPDKIWRALTQGDLLEDWLMKNDVEPVVGSRFSFRADWGSVECQVTEVEPNQRLSYTWAAHGLASVVTWTPTPTRTGTILRMEQPAFARIKPRPMWVPRPDGRVSSRPWNRYWAGRNDGERMDAANAPLAIHHFHADGRCELRCQSAA